MRWVLLFGLMAVIAGCRGDRVDISALSLHDRALFAEAAAIEGVDVTIHGRPGDWEAVYDFDMRRTGMSEIKFKNLNKLTSELPRRPYCKIRLNPNFLGHTCETDSTDHVFKVVIRHELRHCDAQKIEHSPDPNSVMHDPVPCFPTD